MSAYSGYAGKILRIDLTEESVSEYLWSKQEQMKNLGGKILAAQLFLNCLTGSEKAFSEESPVVIAAGPLTGTGTPGSIRFDIAALSPKDNLPAFSNCGGNFGAYLKKAGYDALVLTGRCKEKCWLEIREEGVVFHGADDLWGSGTGKCQDELAHMLGTAKFGRICIGPAGENLVKFASVVGDGHSAGRAGIGAVLGWKNLKAITVSGDKRIALHDPDAAAAWNQEWYACLSGIGGAAGASVCTSCPLHCRKHSWSEEEELLNELGMDAIAGENAAAWAAEQGYALQHLYEDIAFRRGIGDKLAEGVPHRKGKGGKRRGGSYGAIMKAFRLSPDDPGTDAFCHCLTEAVSAAGQCMFTVSALEVTEEGTPLLHVLKMLALVTGMDMDLEKFIQIGARFGELERQIHEKMA